MTARYRLPERFDLNGAIAATDALRARAGADLVLDAGGTVHFGTPGVQTVLVAARAWALAGRSLRLEGVSDACRDQLRLLGFTPDGLTSGASA